MNDASNAEQDAVRLSDLDIWIGDPEMFMTCARPRRRWKCAQ